MKEPTVKADVAVISDNLSSANADRAYVDWPSIFAGAATAATVAIVMGTFGSGIGLTMAGSPWDDGMSSTWFLIAASLWFIWVQVSSVMAGSYLSGRLRRRLGDATLHEVEVRDGAHGVLVWAVMTLAGVLVAIGIALGGASTAVKLGGIAAIGATAAAGDGLGNGRLDQVVARLFRPQGPATADSPAGTAATAPNTTRAETNPAQGNRFPNGEFTYDRRARDELRGVIFSSGMKGELSAEDRDYVVDVATATTGMSRSQALARVDQYLVPTLAELRQTVETARKTGIFIAFVTAATLLISALAGWWAANIGGRHRDQNLDLSRWLSIR